MELGDAIDHIGMLHEQPIPPVVPAEPAAEEEDPEKIEGISEIDSEHAPAELTLRRTTLPPAVLPLWATSTTSRHLRIVLDNM